MNKVGALGLALVSVLAWAAETTLPRGLPELGFPIKLALGAEARDTALIDPSADKQGRSVTIRRQDGRSIKVFLDKGETRIVRIVVSLSKAEYERLSSQLVAKNTPTAQYARENLGAYQSQLWQDRHTILKLVARRGKWQVELTDIGR